VNYRKRNSRRYGIPVQALRSSSFLSLMAEDFASAWIIQDSTVSRLRIVIYSPLCRNSKIG